MREDNRSIRENLKYQTSCGNIITLTSNTLSHLEAHHNIIDFLPEAISQISFPNKEKGRIRMEIDLVTMVGKSSLLNTEQIEIYTDAFFSMRKGREGASRVVLNEKPQETSIISIVAEPLGDKRYNLISAWYGNIAPREPWDSTLLTEPEAFKESLDFWCCHALAHNPEGMDEPFESTWEEIINSHYESNRGGIE